MNNLWIFILFLAYLPVRSQDLDLVGKTNQIIEWTYQSKVPYENPFQQVKLHAIFRNKKSNQKIQLSAFWAGNNTWHFRFSSPMAGEFEFITYCNNEDDAELHNQEGAITITAYTGNNEIYRHGPIHVNSTGEYLTHFDQTAFFWLADSWWHGMTHRLHYPQDFLNLAKDRREKGFNVIQFAIGFPCDIAPFDPRGQNEAGDPWDADFNQINPAYFDLVDLRIETLLDLGLVPNLVGMWGYYLKFMGREKVERHWEYLIARYAAYPLVFTLCGEVTLAYYSDLGEQWDRYKAQFRREWSTIARFIQQNDPFNRLLTVHPGPGINDGKTPIDSMQYIDMVMLQSGHRGFETVGRSNRFILDYRQRFPEKPVIHGEVCFEGMFGSSWQDVQRLLFWSNVLQGTPGYSYGVEGIWQFNSNQSPFGPSPSGHVWGNVPWQEAMHYAGSTQVGLGAKYLRSFNWHKIHPAPHRINRHAGPDNIYDPYVAEMGNELLIYYRFEFGNNEIMINNLSPNSEYRYLFFNPISGQVHPVSTFQSTEEGTWALPDPPVMQDWVLRVMPSGKEQ